MTTFLGALISSGPASELKQVTDLNGLASVHSAIGLAGGAVSASGSRAIERRASEARTAA